MPQTFTWIPAYAAIATKLLDYEDRQDELTAIVEKVLGEKYAEMDPLSFFSMFNGKRVSTNARAQAVRIVLDELGLSADVPSDFNAIPVTNALKWLYWDGRPGNIESNWAVFRAALALADSEVLTDDLRDEFTSCFNAAKAHGNIGDANLTMALFWARPAFFLPLDENTSTYLRNRLGHVVHPIDGTKYLGLLDEVKDKFDMDFAHISYAAWEKSGWVPAPSEYDPGITASHWVELLGDPQIAPHNSLVALKCLNEHPKGATCKELSETYGRKLEFYNTGITLLGENVAKYEGVSPRDEEGGKFWPITCLGGYVKQKRRHGTFEWKLRDELRDALRSVDLSQIPLSEGDETAVPDFDPERFKRLIRLYKKDFYEFRGPDGPEGDRETYKWDNLLTYRKHWNLDADDLQTMIANALKPSATGEGALLGGGFEYPYDRLLKLAGFDTGAFRKAFRELFDPSRSLRAAYSAFSNDMDELLQRYDAESETPLERDYQEPKAASVYLFFEKPDRYYIYKATVAWSLAEAVGATLSNDQLDCFYQYEALCDALIPLVDADAELLELADSVLTPEQAQADVAHHLLLQDIAYYAAQYMKGMNDNWEAILSGEEDAVTTGYVSVPTYPKNLILYGPPGTGKTYQSRAYAVAICDNEDVQDVFKRMMTDEGRRAVVERYHELEEENRVVFTTFHQSYGYEEFIEGLRPDVDDDAESLKYKLEPGIFREFCESAANVVASASATRGIPRFDDNPNPRVWKMGLSTNDLPGLLELCRADSCLRMGWDWVAPEEVVDSKRISDANKRALLAFQEGMQPGDFVVIPGVSSEDYGVAVVTGEFEWKPELGTAIRYRTAHWLDNIKKTLFMGLNGGKRLTLQSVYELSRVSASQLLEAMGLVEETQRESQSKKNYVFIIDEINRGNISKIFGELITLLEEDKRKGASEALTVKLPYSGADFSVPSNVYVLGTMNTADRSITNMDTALRRRFSFIEVMPDTSVLEGIKVDGTDINVPMMLDAMNKRIGLLHDREHTLGHSFFMSLKHDPSIDCLCGIFRDHLIPLLQEYFFDDYSKIGVVFGAAKDDFIKEVDATDVFWRGEPEDYGHLKSYELKSMPRTADAYKRIYQLEREAAPND